MAFSTTSAGASLPTTPRAPQRTAIASSSWSRLPLSIITREMPLPSSSGRKSRALWPSRSRSSTMTSGCSWAASVTAAGPSPAVRTIALDQFFQAPQHGLVVIDQHNANRRRGDSGLRHKNTLCLQGNINLYHGHAGRTQRHRHRAAEGGGALGDGAGQEVRHEVLRIVVFDADLQHIVVTAQRDAAAPGIGVLADIAHAFIDDLEHFGGQAVADGQLVARFDGYVDVVKITYLVRLEPQRHQQFRYLAGVADADIAGEVAHVGDHFGGHEQ